MKIRKRTIFRLIRRYKISIHVPPRVRLMVYQKNGKYSVGFGRYGQNEMSRLNMQWLPDGTHNPVNIYRWSSGWCTDVFDWSRLYRYIREASFDGLIHPLDLA